MASMAYSTWYRRPGSDTQCSPDEQEALKRKTFFKMTSGNKYDGKILSKTIVSDVKATGGRMQPHGKHQQELLPSGEKIVVRESYRRD